LKGQEVKIVLEDDNFIFKRPYRLSEVERAFIQARTTELMDASLMELSRGEYASATMMLTKKEIFGNWTEWCMCGDYHPVNKHMCLDKYAMPLLKDIFDALGQAKVFSTLDLRFSYHQLPLKEGDKVKITFWGINLHGEDCLYQWRFMPFGLRNVPAKF
jgi:hypothetical protein